VAKGRSEDPRSRTYRIGEVATATGLSRQTLHQYVLLGLLEPAATTAGGHRCFGAGVFRRLDEIRVLKRDRTLAEIREHFRARAGSRRGGRS
jgi:DNA-binding transcriptional MerR regulator